MPDDIRKMYHGGIMPPGVMPTIYSSDGAILDSDAAAISETPDEPIMLCFTQGLPDFVVIPKEIHSGGEKAYIDSEERVDKCPLCRQDEGVRMFKFKPPHEHLAVAGCPVCAQYIWVSLADND